MHLNLNFGGACSKAISGEFTILLGLAGRIRGFVMRWAPAVASQRLGWGLCYNGNFHDWILYAF